MAPDPIASLQRRAAGVYLLLLSLTSVTVSVGHAGAGGLWVSLAVLGLALLKGQLIGDYFMGLKGIRGPWRWVILLWLLLVGVLIATGFALAAAG
ncbi:MAG: O-succinylhomoserine sulfhydrylase [Alphaproteobacteria bacterium]|jgi:hypothetical protein|nr:O-succinylhomoserine sulfhydrylase [Alphaproteobacteria bacterium]